MKKSKKVKKNINDRDIKPNKDAKGGGGHAVTGQSMTGQSATGQSLTGQSLSGQSFSGQSVN
jgi:hypothetical protein